MFITYKITCKITGQYYIGSHKTNDINDDYMGSGRYIRESIRQYGVENHIKEIIGIFETRQESLDLEHLLVKECRKKDAEMCLNQTNGGSSFDYINDNLTFDRAYFGSLASHDSAKQIYCDNVLSYNNNPKRCPVCDRIIDYDRRFNTFCSKSCAAVYNNAKRPKSQKIAYCKYCGKLLHFIDYHKKQFCNISCAAKYRHNNKPKQISDKRRAVLQDLDIIKERHKTESYRTIAKDYNVSGQFIKEAIKGRLGNI